jgi:hypothetical protein
MPPQYKFVEVSPVTAEALEAAVNEWVAQGWQLDGIRFAGGEPAPRPQLAFVWFTRSPDQAGQPATAVATEAPPEPGPRPLEPPEQAARVITAARGDEVE